MNKKLQEQLSEELEEMKCEEGREVKMESLGIEEFGGIELTEEEGTSDVVHVG